MCGKLSKLKQNNFKKNLNLTATVTGQCVAGEDDLGGGGRGGVARQGRGWPAGGLAELVGASRRHCGAAGGAVGDCMRCTGRRRRGRRRTPPMNWQRHRGPNAKTKIWGWRAE